MATTTYPALPHVPRDDLGDLTDKQRAILARAVHGKEAHKMLVYSLLASNNWDEETVEDRSEALLAYLQRPVPDSTVSSLYGLEPNGVPRACTVLLEDGRGGVARDVAGNPVSVAFGVMPAVTTETLLDMAVWMARRLQRHVGDTELPQTTHVIDLLWNKGET